MKIFFISLSLLFFQFTWSQVIDIEHLRLDNKNQGFAGSVGFDIKLTKNTSDIFGLGAKAYFQFRKDDHLIFLISNVNFEKVDEKENINDGTNHLRYNYYWKPRIILEAFYQSQYNEISKIERRQLAGAGPRFVIHEGEKFKSFFGTILMYENEKVSEDEIVYNKDIRFSFYLPLRYKPTENIALSSTTFYQPKIDVFDDFRVFSYNAATIKIIKNLNFVITYIYEFDQFPAQGIPKTQYRLLNGISYSFD